MTCRESIRTSETNRKHGKFDVLALRNTTELFSNGEIALVEKVGQSAIKHGISPIRKDLIMTKNPVRLLDLRPDSNLVEKCLNHNEFSGQWVREASDFSKYVYDESAQFSNVVCSSLQRAFPRVRKISIYCSHDTRGKHHAHKIANNWTHALCANRSFHKTGHGQFLIFGGIET